EPAANETIPPMTTGSPLPYNLDVPALAIGHKTTPTCGGRPGLPDWRHSTTERQVQFECHTAVGESHKLKQIHLFSGDHGSRQRNGLHTISCGFLRSGTRTHHQCQIFPESADRSP